MYTVGTITLKFRNNAIIAEHWKYNQHMYVGCSYEKDSKERLTVLYIITLVDFYTTTLIGGAPWRIMALHPTFTITFKRHVCIIK